MISTEAICSFVYALAIFTDAEFASTIYKCTCCEDGISLFNNSATSISNLFAKLKVEPSFNCFITACLHLDQNIPRLEVGRP